MKDLKEKEENKDDKKKNEENQDKIVLDETLFENIKTKYAKECAAEEEKIYEDNGLDD